MGPQDDKDVHGGDAGDGTSHRSGDGAGSAMEAMLRKRQMRVDPQPHPDGPPTSQQQDGRSLKE
jgi:hypothetical protein